MKTYLFLFTVGPVQSFIAQARKVHDLHSGSAILSELCRAAALHFKSKELGGEVVFPDINSSSIPNRFLGKIKSDPKKIAKIGEDVTKAVQTKWMMEFDKFAKNLHGSAWVEAKRQMEEHLDIEWLFQELTDDSDETYRMAYDELNKNLNAVKNTRPFHTSEETGRKCSLDGERNVVFYRKTKEQQANIKKNESLQDGSPLYSTSNIVLEYRDLEPIQLRHLQPGEGLSAVSMAKRMREFDSADFPSTAEFALAETMRVAGDKAKKDMTKLFGHDHPKYLNWQVFYEENLTDIYFDKQGLDPRKREQAIEIQKILKDAAKEKGCNLDKYYAVVVFDGDHMGKWWNGEFLQASQKLEPLHQALTQQLAAYSKLVQTEFAKVNRRGWVIYSGGDDFLGFFNLHYLGEALEYLCKTYEETVYKPLATQIEGDAKLTFSAGVCIANYKEPLSLVLSMARKLEKDAKDLRDSKNAIGIGVIPGSGQTASAILPFEGLQYLNAVTAALQSLEFSNAFIAKARSEMSAFVAEDMRLKQIFAQQAIALLERAISRACNLKADSETEKAYKQQQIESLNQNALNLLHAFKDNLHQFFDALDIADFIERQTHISKPKGNKHETNV